MYYTDVNKIVFIRDWRDCTRMQPTKHMCIAGKTTLIKSTTECYQLRSIRTFDVRCYQPTETVSKIITGKVIKWDIPTRY